MKVVRVLSVSPTFQKLAWAVSAETQLERCLLLENSPYTDLPAAPFLIPHLPPPHRLQGLPCPLVLSPKPPGAPTPTLASCPSSQCLSLDGL